MREYINNSISKGFCESRVCGESALEGLNRVQLQFFFFRVIYSSHKLAFLKQLLKKKFHSINNINQRL